MIITKILTVEYNIFVVEYKNFSYKNSKTRHTRKGGVE